jgi:SAM-dependent methyltransferase
VSPPSRSAYPYHLTPGGPDLLRQLLRRAAEPRSWSADSVLLHLGCRHGENTFALRDVFPGAVVGTDEDPEAIFFAKMAAARPGAGERVSFRLQSPLAPGAAERRYDAVVCDAMLGGYPRARVLSALHRALAPGGALIATDTVWLREPVPTFVRDAWDAASFRTLSREAFRREIEEAGFAVERAEDHRGALDGFYRQFGDEVHTRARDGSDDTAQLRALVRRYKHEIDVYLRQGGKAYMGFASVVGGKSVKE